MTLRKVFETWWPLAASWMLMGLELPLVAAFMARMPHPEVSLAAYGGAVFPVSLIIEGPVIMLLAASTALSKDWASFVLMRRFMMGLGLALTLVHAAVAFTPLFDSVVVRLLGTPPEIREAARLGLRIFLPWTWSIAFRRFHQGVLIRGGHSRSVGVGTLVRLAALLGVLVCGYAFSNRPAIEVGTAAVSLGVVAEAVFIGLRVRPVLRERIRPAAPVDPPLTAERFARFYTPLALTPFITLFGQPLVSAAVSRMPNPVESLAVLPVLHGVTFLLRSLGFAYNEVVVSLLDAPEALARLKRFALILGACTSTILLVMNVTPLAGFYLGRMTALAPDLVALGKVAFWIVIPLPALAVALHFYQGILVHAHRTVAVTEATVVNIAVMAAILFAGVRYGMLTGLYVGAAAHVAGNLAQPLWLRYRSRS